MFKIWRSFLWGEVLIFWFRRTLRQPGAGKKQAYICFGANLGLVVANDMAARRQTWILTGGSAGVHSEVGALVLLSAPIYLCLFSSFTFCSHLPFFILLSFTLIFFPFTFVFWSHLPLSFAQKFVQITRLSAHIFNSRKWKNWVAYMRRVGLFVSLPFCQKAKIYGYVWDTPNHFSWALLKS